ncbi:hypothetical protein BDN70DRAFT_878842 [Pholiota conissans]|uniref:Uncharacterized protein n=1 Tax=Pholiota conissans TaxID=109636 RepID=A0A9P5Z4L0_9AGAR|nr:hypothetical protein BDN70DRAFT_878842 [Pholiota conissans]
MSYYHPPYPSASAGPSTQHEAPKKKRRYLSSDANALLRARAQQWSNQGIEPTLAMRKQLLRQVHALPECDYYTLPALTNWLKLHMTTNYPQQSTENTRFASLNEATRAQLAALLGMEEGHNPSPEKVRIWANMVKTSGATYTDVVDWVKHLQIEFEKQAEKEATTRLPTPGTTVSPEPVSPVMKSPAMPFVPPVVAYAGEHSFYARSSPPQSPATVKPPFMIRKTAALAGPPPTQGPLSSPQLPTPISPNFPYSSPVPTMIPPAKRTPRPSMSIPHTPAPAQRAPTLHEIVAQSVAEAAASPTTPKEALPTTAAEFTALFDPYEAKLSKLLQVLKS